jgi:predicted amidophosphoribosyltransferase
MLDLTRPQALFFYELAIKELIKGAKFGGRLTSALALRQLLKEALRADGVLAALKAFAPTHVSYIPTHWLRRSIRGLDLPSFLAKSLAKELGCPLIHCLRKSKFSDQQSKITKRAERLLKARGIFSLRKHVACERLLLLDDIVTTGATLAEAKRVLSTSCRQIGLLALAETP